MNKNQQRLWIATRVLIAMLSLTISLSAQETQPLTNADVLAMVKARLSAEIITAKIKASPDKFDTSPTTLGELKSAGVPDSVILAMVEAAPPKQADSQKPHTSDNSCSKYISNSGDLTAYNKCLSERRDVLSTEPLKEPRPIVKSASLPANAPSAQKRPELWNHHLGETISEFAATEGTTPDKMCAVRSIQIDAPKDPVLGRKIEPCNLPPHTKMISSDTSMTVRFGRIASPSAHFASGRIDSMWDLASDFDEAVVLISKDYGSPNKLEYASLENRFGATWKAGTAAWNFTAQVPDSNEAVHVSITIRQKRDFGVKGAYVTLALDPVLDMIRLTQDILDGPIGTQFHYH